MDIVYHAFVAVVTAAGITLATLIGGAVNTPPSIIERPDTVITICGSAGLVPLDANGNPVNNCND
jgi:hypothetical protein